MFEERDNFVPEPVCKTCNLEMEFKENWEENTKFWKCKICDFEIPIKNEF